jgi:starch synthase
MKIAMIASECTPFIKTGGLADVIGALPKTLNNFNNKTIVILPLYSQIDIYKHNINLFYESMCVHMGNKEEWCSVYKSTKYGFDAYFIDFKAFFGRNGLYNDENNEDFNDNSYRFAFFSRAAMQLCVDMGFEADILHAHDWQSAFVMPFLKLWDWQNTSLNKSKGVFTIHNIAYQGVYSSDIMDYAGFWWNHFNSEEFEDNGRVNFLKSGIIFSDLTTTVSPTYAFETKSSFEGRGMGPYLNNKKENYVGILNGVDYSIWNPEIDKLIPANYSQHNLSGKKICKTELQKRFGLEVNPDIPIFGIVSRFASQKGLDLFIPIAKRLVNEMKLQLVVLGSGDKGLERFFGELPGQEPLKIGSYIGYNEELSHLIEAGSDFFLMPSRYEPCGLNQIYSLKYGTIPIVNAVGGLNDTIEQYNEFDGTGTGLKFYTCDSQSLFNTIGWAVSTFFDRKHHFEMLRKSGMDKDFSWDRSAQEYMKFYKKLK